MHTHTPLQAQKILDWTVGSHCDSHSHTQIFIFYLDKQTTNAQPTDADSSCLQPTDCFVWKILKTWSRADVNIPEAESGSDYLDETLSDRNMTAVDKNTHTHTHIHTHTLDSSHSAKHLDNNDNIGQEHALITGGMPRWGRSMAERPVTDRLKVWSMQQLKSASQDTLSLLLAVTQRSPD